MELTPPKYRNKITVITPTVRPEGLNLVQKALEQQEFTNFDWIVCSTENPHTWATWIPNPKKNEGDYWAIYKAYNAMIRQADSELIVSWQDFTYAKPDTLERLWFHYQNDPKSIVGAVGNKYQNDKWLVKTWQDPREKGFDFHEVLPQEVEYNLCSFPREAVYAAGGFDESLDQYSSVCGLDFSMRLAIIGGYKFFLDQSIKSYSTEHGRLKDWEENEPFNGPWQKKLEEYNHNPKLNFL